MARICKGGFEKEFIKEQRDVYGIAYTQNMLSGRWKYLILWFLKTKERRYSEIKAFLWDISQGSLTKQLRELETDGLIKREVFPEVPPRVEYSLTTIPANIRLITIQRTRKLKKNGLRSSLFFGGL